MRHSHVFRVVLLSVQTRHEGSERGTAEREKQAAGTAGNQITQVRRGGSNVIK